MDMKVREVIVVWERNGWRLVRQLPGCTAAGSSREEVDQLMREAVEAHVEVLRSEGLAVPQPSSFPDTQRRSFTSGRLDHPTPDGQSE